MQTFISLLFLFSYAHADFSPNSFTDSDLRQLLKNNHSGIIYTWSPSMPLSIKGVTTIRRAAQKLRIALVVLLDPYANLEVAKKEATKLEIPVRRIESLELLRLNVNIHFPTLIVFSKGHLIKRVIPGYKEAKQYEKVITHLLGE